MARNASARMSGAGANGTGERTEWAIPAGRRGWFHAGWPSATRERADAGRRAGTVPLHHGRFARANRSVAADDSLLHYGRIVAASARARTDGDVRPWPPAPSA